MQERGRLHNQFANLLFIQPSSESEFYTTYHFHANFYIKENETEAQTDFIYQLTVLDNIRVKTLCEKKRREGQHRRNGQAF